MKIIEKINDINDSDILKLERDYKVHGATSAFLVYQSAGDANNKEISIEYGPEIFSFKSININVSPL